MGDDMLQRRGLARALPELAKLPNAILIVELCTVHALLGIGNWGIRAAKKMGELDGPVELMEPCERFRKPGGDIKLCIVSPTRLPTFPI